MAVIPGTFQVAISGTLGPSRWTNVLHVDNGDTTTLDITEAQLIVDTIADVFDARKGAFSDQFDFDEAVVTDLRTATGPRFEITPVPLVAGTDGSQLLPLQTALVISLGTGIRGRSFRGRIYLCGFTEAVSADGVGPDASSLATYQAFANDLVNDLDTIAGHPLVVASRKLLESNVVTDATVDQRWDTVRNRNSA